MSTMIGLKPDTVDYFVRNYGKSVEMKARYRLVEMKEDFKLPDGTSGFAGEFLAMPVTGDDWNTANVFILSAEDRKSGYYTPKTRKPKEDKADVVDS